MLLQGALFAGCQRRPFVWAINIKKKNESYNLPCWLLGSQYWPRYASDRALTFVMWGWSLSHWTHIERFIPLIPRWTFIVCGTYTSCSIVLSLTSSLTPMKGQWPFLWAPPSRHKYWFFVFIYSVDDVFEIFDVFPSFRLVYNIFT